MSLRALLYRCPECGDDRVVGLRGGVRCPACERQFTLGTGGTRIRVLDAAGGEVEVEASRLARRVDAWESRREKAAHGDGEWKMQALGSMQAALAEDPVRQRGELLGFVERRGPCHTGTLSLDDEALHFETVEGSKTRWSLLDLRALQGSSSSVQISPPEGGVVTFRFERDSARRWEDRLRRALRAAWIAADRGEIVEFQPRIRAT